MKILVVDTNQNDRDLAEKFLTNLGFEVQLAPDSVAARSFLALGLPDAILVDALLPRGQAFEFVKFVRSSAPDKHPLVVMTSPELTPEDIRSSISAGVDDLLRKPFLKEELMMRVCAKERILRWATEQSVADDWNSSTKIDDLRAWTQLEAACSKDIAAIFGGSFISVRPEVKPGWDYGAELRLTMAVEELEVRVVVALDRPSMQKAAQRVFGAPESPDDALCDVVRELANVVAGTFKSSAAAQGIALTMGLPIDRKSEEPDVAPMASKDAYIQSEDGEVLLVVTLQVRSNKLQKVSADELREGMILAREIRNPFGALLVPAGRLTRLGLSRVAKAVPAKTMLDVAASGHVASQGR